LQFNSHPIKDFVITEDSGIVQTIECIPEEFRKNFTLIINKEPIGQIKSIDKAYSSIKTTYIFHCEDDWEFYRTCFIEDSKELLALNKSILQVWLRSYYYDIRIHSSYHYWGERLEHNGVIYHRVMSNKPDWQGFSFNPGLRRLNDYHDIGKYGDYDHEKSLSKLYHDKGMWAATLEADAVAHTGFGSHVPDIRENKKKAKKKFKATLTAIALIVFSSVIGYLLSISNVST